MIKSKQAVEQFLNQFGIKLDIWGIFYLDRDKNEEALKALESPKKLGMKLFGNYIQTIM